MSIIEQLIMPLAQKLWAGPFARIVLYGVKRLRDGSRYHIVWLSWCVNTHLTLGFYWVRYLMVMGENKMCTLKHCVYCNKPLGVTGKKSEEHIIQNALGGLLTSSEICCSECNNYLSRFIDAPFTKYFAPFLNYIPELNKTNKKKSIPGYPVGVEYNGKEYKGVAKKGKLCECGALCKELRTKLSDIRPAPEIIYIEYPLDNKIYRNGMAKIAFNFALQKGININILKHGLIIDRDKDKITSIGFNYQIIPFFPMNCFDEALELYEPMKLFHGMILFNNENYLWCYIDLFNTYQVYVLLSDQWDVHQPFYKEYYQLIQRPDRSVGKLDLSGTRRVQDFYSIATRYKVESTRDIDKLQAEINERIRKKSYQVKLSTLIPSIFDSNNLANPKSDLGFADSIEYYSNSLFLFNNLGDLNKDRFRALTLNHSHDIVSYPRYIRNELCSADNDICYTNTRDYTYKKFYRLCRNLKHLQLSICK